MMRRAQETQENAVRVLFGPRQACRIDDLAKIERRLMALVAKATGTDAQSLAFRGSMTAETKNHPLPYLHDNFPQALHVKSCWLTERLQGVLRVHFLVEPLPPHLRCFEIAEDEAEALSQQAQAQRIDHYIAPIDDPSWLYAASHEGDEFGIEF